MNTLTRTTETSHEVDGNPAARDSHSGEQYHGDAGGGSRLHWSFDFDDGAESTRAYL